MVLTRDYSEDLRNILIRLLPFDPPPHKCIPVLLKEVANVPVKIGSDGGFRTVALKRFPVLMGLFLFFLMFS